jgi:hypothetical protein
MDPERSMDDARGRRKSLTRRKSLKRLGGHGMQLRSHLLVFWPTHSSTQLLDSSELSCSEANRSTPCRHARKRRFCGELASGVN